MIAAYYMTSKPQWQKHLPNDVSPSPKRYTRDILQDIKTMILSYPVVQDDSILIESHRHHRLPDYRQTLLQNDDLDRTHMAKENAKICYSRNIFVCEDSHTLSQLLVTDPFKLAINPAACIRHLTVNLEILPFRGNSSPGFSSLERTYKDLSALAYIERKDLLDICYCVATEFTQVVELGHERAWYNFLEILRFPAYDMTFWGSRINVLHEVEDEWFQDNWVSIRLIDFHRKEKTRTFS